MATPPLSDSGFLLGHCRACGREVLTHIDLDPNDVEMRRCLHCDTVIREGFRPASAREIEEAGYTVIEARACSSGGCSAGGCNTHTH